MKSFGDRQLIAIVLAGAILLAIKFVFPTYRVPQGAMAPAIPAGTRVMAMRAHEAKRGQIIVFRWPRDQRYLFTMRVVALGGETVELRDRQLYVNGRKLDEPYAVYTGAGARRPFGPLKVPDDCYFVLGDNRDAASDSREWGAVPRRNVTGVIVLAGFRRV